MRPGRIRSRFGRERLVTSRARFGVFRLLLRIRLEAAWWRGTRSSWVSGTATTSPSRVRWTPSSARSFGRHSTASRIPTIPSTAKGVGHAPTSTPTGCEIRSVSEIRRSDGPHAEPRPHGRASGSDPRLPRGSRRGADKLTGYDRAGARRGGVEALRLRVCGRRSGDTGGALGALARAQERMDLTPGPARPCRRHRLRAAYTIWVPNTGAATRRRSAVLASKTATVGRAESNGVGRIM